MKLKRDLSEFRIKYDECVELLKFSLTTALNLPIGSQLRNNASVNIAVQLRTLMCHVSGVDSLISRCDYTNDIIFPFTSRNNEVLNVLPNYIQVGIKVQNNVPIFESLVENECSKIPQLFITWRAWMDEIIIDFKDNETHPISRQKLIRILADELGAHVDNEIKEELYYLRTHNVMPLNVVVDGKVYTGEGSNLFAEAMLSIAQDFIYADDYYRMIKKKRIGVFSLYGCILDYTNDGKKYFVSKDDKTEMITRYSAEYNKGCYIEKTIIGRYIIQINSTKYDNIGIITI